MSLVFRSLLLGSASVYDIIASIQHSRTVLVNRWHISEHIYLYMYQFFPFHICIVSELWSGRFRCADDALVSYGTSCGIMYCVYFVWRPSKSAEGVRTPTAFQINTNIFHNKNP